MQYFRTLLECQNKIREYEREDAQLGKQMDVYEDRGLVGSLCFAFHEAEDIDHEKFLIWKKMREMRGLPPAYTRARGGRS